MVTASKWQDYLTLHIGEYLNSFFSFSIEVSHHSRNVLFGCAFLLDEKKLIPFGYSDPFQVNRISNWTTYANQSQAMATAIKNCLLTHNILVVLIVDCLIILVVLSLPMK